MTDGGQPDDPQRAASDPRRVADDPRRATDDPWRAADDPRKAADDPWRATNDPRRATDDWRRVKNSIFSELKRILAKKMDNRLLITIIVLKEFEKCLKITFQEVWVRNDNLSNQEGLRIINSQYTGVYFRCVFFF